MEAEDAEDLARWLNEVFEGREIDVEALRRLREEASRRWRERTPDRGGRPDISIFQEDDGTWLRPRGGFGGGRHIELWRDGDSGIRMMVPPMYGQAPSPPVAMMQQEMQRRTENLEQIEQRLERIERMLEQLLETR